jgi:hypothetical protein
MTLNEDPQFATFFKMMRMGVPKGAVMNKMAQAGLDPKYADMDPNSPSPNAGAVTIASD